MQDGIRLLFRRFIAGLFVLVALGPLIKFWTEYAEAMEYSHFMGAVSLVLIGLDFINFLVVAGVGIAVFYLYYRGTNKRKYGDEEEHSYYQEEYK